MTGSEPLIQEEDPHITELTVELGCRIRWSKKMVQVVIVIDYFFSDDLDITTK